MTNAPPNDVPLDKGLPYIFYIFFIDFGEARNREQDLTCIKPYLEFTLYIDQFSKFDFLPISLTNSEIFCGGRHTFGMVIRENDRPMHFLEIV